MPVTWLVVPARSTRPTALAWNSANQTAPSGPRVTPKGSTPLLANAVAPPLGVTLPTVVPWPAYQMFPSPPRIRSIGDPAGTGKLVAVGVAPVVTRATEPGVLKFATHMFPSAPRAMPRGLKPGGSGIGVP